VIFLSHILIIQSLKSENYYNVAQQMVEFIRVSAVFGGSWLVNKAGSKLIGKQLRNPARNPTIKRWAQLKRTT